MWEWYYSGTLKGGTLMEEPILNQSPRAKNLADVAFYIRKSREDDGGVEETLSRQNQILRTLADKNGVEQFDVYQEVESSVIMERPELTSLLQKIKQYSAIYVTHIDRLGRDIGILDTIKKLCIKHGVAIVTPDQNITFKNDNEDLLFGFSSVLSDYEYKRIRHRLLKGRVDSVRYKGRYVGSVAPYGYKVNPETLQLEVIPEQARWVTFIKDKALQGYTVPEIASELQKRGAKSATGLPFPQSSVRIILRNKHYTGNLYYSSEALGETVEVENTHEALMTTEEFEKVQKIVRSRSTRPKNKKLGCKSALDGLIYCSRCGSYKYIKVPLAKNRKKRLNPHIEACTRLDSSTGEKCKGRGLRVYILEDVVFDKLREKEKEIKEDLERLSNSDSTVSTSLLEDKEDDIRSEIKQKQTALERLLDVYLDMGIDKDTYLKRKNSLEQQITVLESDLTAVSKEIATLDTSKRVQKLSDSYDVIQKIKQASTAEQNRLMRTIIKSVDVFREGDTIDVTINWL